jgi:adenylate cyclase class 2
MMGNEIEVKVLDIDVSDIKNRLQTAGCEYLGQEFQQNYMFDYANRRLYEEQDGSYIRLRRSHYFSQQLEASESTVLTYKKTLSRERFKIAQETETAVADFEQARQFLLLLDLRQMRSDEKLRQRYRFEDILFEIDEWAGLPPYLEVEATSEDRVAFWLSLL